MKMANWRDRYSNPVPPAGYVHTNPRVELEPPYEMIDGTVCRYLGIIIESVLLNDSNPSTDLDNCDFDTSTDEEEILVLPVAKKIDPPVIDLDGDSSDGLLPTSDSDSKDSSKSKLPSKDSAHSKTPVEDTNCKDTTKVYAQQKSPTRQSSHKEPPTSQSTRPKSPTPQLTPKSPTRHPAQPKSPIQQPTQPKSPIRHPRQPKSPIRHPTYPKSPPRQSSRPKSPSRDSNRTKSPTRESTHRSKDSSQHKSSNEYDKMTERMVSVKIEGTSLKESRRTSPKDKKHGKKDKKYESYSSDESNYSSHSKKKSKHKKRRRSVSPCATIDDDSDFEEKKNIKKEYQYFDYPIKQESSNLYGSWYCKECKILMNSEGTYLSHIQGKRHMKALKQQNVTKTITDSVNPAAIKSRYPLPLPHVHRVKTKDIATSQSVIEDSVKTPCPGLEKVIEIQGISETTYYCELCDAPCTTNSIISHLTGHKHQLRCLKYFNPEMYESFRYRKKHDIEGKVIKYLRDVQKRKGLGKLTVEREFLSKPEKYDYGDSSESRRREEMPGPSRIDPEDAFPDSFSMNTAPDTSKADFYCAICDSHMNNHNMWESHIRGKRHLTNLKKQPGEAPSKTKSIHMPNVRPLILDELEHVVQPVVGLQFIRETQNPEVSGAQYNCFLCGACMTQIDVVEHILSQKHRTKFLEAINHPDMMTLKEMSMQECRMGSIIDEICAQVEAENGRECVEVYVIRSAVARW